MSLQKISRNVGNLIDLLFFCNKACFLCEFERWWSRGVNTVCILARPLSVRERAPPESLVRKMAPLRWLKKFHMLNLAALQLQIHFRLTLLLISFTIFYIEHFYIRYLYLYVHETQSCQEPHFHCFWVLLSEGSPHINKSLLPRKCLNCLHRVWFF